MKRILSICCLLELCSCSGGGGGNSRFSNDADIWVGDGPGVVRLEWQQPTARENGALLETVQGYNVYREEGTSVGRMIRGVVSVGEVPVVTIHGLSAGQHYFSVSAVDNQGLESKPTEYVSIAVPDF